MGENAAGALEWLALLEYELLLFAGFFFLLGAIDELSMDFAWFWLRFTGRAQTPVLSRQHIYSSQLTGRAAVLVPAWQEAKVICDTLSHALAVWPQDDLRIYVGVYRNDPETLEAAARGAQGDGRVRIVVHDRDGPSTKADCLNRLFRAMQQDELREGREARMVVLHDAEDMVDSAALVLLDRAIGTSQFVQLPVLPMPRKEARWIGSHYCEEFAEAHGKSMVVRNALGVSLPAAGVGCAFDRRTLEKIARKSDRDAPFDEDSLTEDYELGINVAAIGGKSSFLRVRGENGHLIATRAYFPEKLGHAVRQKARWMHGIALQGWDRLGWTGGPGEWWMRLRDRRGPLSAVVLFAGYSLMVLALLLAGLRYAGMSTPWQPSGLLLALLAFNIASFAWRAFMRFNFTKAEYGWREGLRAVTRIPVANVISIMAGYRALFAYTKTLRGEAPHWEKTAHDAHPARTSALEYAR
ncbi:glycosyl transferase family protein [Aurantiacibacter rhizosphaerae]|uniref:Glycosyl transferase family protein n=1 Tax=Aurantiacibacter rhizosphaerae TaxID=2691582 RepID=A0A844XCR0_9SPHN|nr:glycosyl transferase family protein [Aurantiacibacter rhizosphaerae]MWV27295.1 glycosyl transferase family protein [Aurantiacibacter rhizosphaerae]